MNSEYDNQTSFSVLVTDFELVILTVLLVLLLVMYVWEIFPRILVKVTVKGGTEKTSYRGLWLVTRRMEMGIFWHDFAFPE